MTKDTADAAWLAFSEGELASLKGADIKAQAEAMGLGLDPSGTRALAGFLGRDYLVGNDGVSAADGGNVTVMARSVMAHYVNSRGRGAPSGEFLPLGRLAGRDPSASGGKGDPDRLAKPLGDKFGADFTAFRKAALALGASDLGESEAGARSFLFGGLPKLPLRVDFFEADEEFPAEIKVLVPANAVVFASREVLKLAVMCLTVALLLEAGLIGCPDDCQSSFE